VESNGVQGFCRGTSSTLYGRLNSDPVQTRTLYASNYFCYRRVASFGVQLASREAYAWFACMKRAFGDPLGLARDHFARLRLHPAEAHCNTLNPSNKSNLVHIINF
jgi:acyl-ACP thioesterase